MQKKRPIVNMICETSKQSLVDANGFIISPYNFYSLNNILVRLEVLSEGNKVDLSNIQDFYFGLDNGFNDGKNLILIEDYNVDTSWDSLEDGLTSFILDLRTQDIIDFIGTNKSKNLYSEIWIKEGGDPVCILSQQSCKLYNTLSNNFPPELCGIGEMVISGETGCIFRIY